MATGDIVKDSQALRLFADEKQKVPLILAHSFSKIFGLYGQRIGCLSTICDTEQEVTAVQSQLKVLARRLYSNPPVHGARLVTTILNNPELFQLWIRVFLLKKLFFFFLLTKYFFFFCWQNNFFFSVVKKIFFFFSVGKKIFIYFFLFDRKWRSCTIVSRAWGNCW